MRRIDWSVLSRHDMSWRALLSAAILPCALALASYPAEAETTPQPTSPQPTLPQAVPGVSLASPVLGGGTDQRKPLVVRKKVSRTARLHHRHRRLHIYDAELDRPALEGVELVAPLPYPPQPPHVIVPTPAYPLENFITAFTTPVPPVFCHRVPRDPYAPDPHLVYEKTVVCEADNP